MQLKNTNDTINLLDGYKELREEKKLKDGYKMLRVLMERKFSVPTISTAVGLCSCESKNPPEANKAVLNYLDNNPEVEEKIFWRYLQDVNRKNY